MCFPIMNKQPRRNVNIPDLAGGVNYRDGITEVHDNQLTDCKNMWFKDGVLRTRAGAKHITEHELPNFADNVTYTYKTNVFKEIEFYVGGEKSVLTTVHQISSDKAEGDVIWTYWTGKKGNHLFGLIDATHNSSYFLVMFKKTLYCFVSDHKIYKCTEWDYPEWENGAWKEVSEEEIYAPLIATGVTFIKGTEEYDDLYVLSNATMIEGFNLIGNRMRFIGSTVNPSYLKENGVEKHLMKYSIPYAGSEEARERITKILKITITYSGMAKAVHTATVKESGAMFSEKEINELDGLKMFAGINGTVLNIWFEDENGKTVEVGEGDYINDNMEIIAPIGNSLESLNRIFSMTRATWFGGASEGINGGTRLFLGGNTAEGEESLMVWSDLNEPLYFPENACAYVGNATSAVTGFGKQSDMLVIFKENETYFTQYQRNTSITADDLIDQSVIDYASSRVYFPLTLINADIGCDLPDTVELCRNRLVWTNSNGKMYTLTSNNQYSERNIYEVGEMVERRLKGLDLSYASACDWAGYYVLLIGNKAFLMDYNSNGYQYVYSFNKNEDAQKNIPWYEWEFGFKNKLTSPCVISNGGYMFVLGVYGSSALCYIIPEDKNEFEGEDPAESFVSSFATKAFDFGAAGYRKNVDVVKLFLGNNGGAPIKVEFVTDCGTVSEEIILDSPETENYTAGYISTVSLAPPIRSIVRMALRVSSEGKLAVDGAELTYRILGGAR